MRSIEQVKIFSCFEGRGKIKQIQCSADVFNRVMKIGGILRIIEDNQVIEFAGQVCNRRKHKSRSTSKKSCKRHLGRLGQREAIRYLQTAGIIQIKILHAFWFHQCAKVRRIIKYPDVELGYNWEKSKKKVMN